MPKNAYFGDTTLLLKKLLSVALLTLIAGCQTTSSQVAPLVNPGGDVTLIFNRESTVLTSIVRARVFIGDNDVCAIPIGDSCQVNVSGGSYIIKVFPYASSTLGTFTHRYAFESGKTYRFMISPNDPALVFNFITTGIVYTEATRKSSEDTNNGDFTMKLIGE